MICVGSERPEVVVIFGMAKLDFTTLYIMCFMKIQSSTCDRVPSEVDDGGWPLASKVQLNCATFFPMHTSIDLELLFHQVSTNKIHTIHNPKLIYMQCFFSYQKCLGGVFYEIIRSSYRFKCVFYLHQQNIFSPHFFSVNTKPFG